MNRRSFLSALGSGLVALNLTFGFRPVEAETVAPPAAPSDRYRMVVNLTALEDLKPGDVVVRSCADEDGARKARQDDLFYGICENYAVKGRQALVCVHGSPCLPQVVS